jgi:DNA topoisomerase-1
MRDGVALESTMPAPPAAARAAGLRYVNGGDPGLRRVRAGRGFRYVDADGRPVREASTLARIRALAVPPAWRDVWICSSPQGHIQAVGRDRRGRKQYRYHPRWRAVRDEAKYERMLAFAQTLPELRAQIDADLRRAGLPREKVLATVVRLLEATLIRVGNDEYARHNRSYGLTTMKDRHADVSAHRIEFRFRGKSGRTHVVGVADPRLARIVRKCQELPGEELFQYLDRAGRVRDVQSGDVNDYLRAITRRDFTAKDFRTWAGTVLAAWALAEGRTFTTKTQARKNVGRAVEAVASRLGNTVAVCRKCYIHPGVLDSYLDGSLARALRSAAEGVRREARGLSRREAAVLALLSKRLAQESRKTAPRAARRSRPVSGRRIRSRGRYARSARRAGPASAGTSRRGRGPSLPRRDRSRSAG